jgi:formylglycine-generating enzyme required for sulfatase activity
MKKKYVWLAVPALLVLAGCPNDASSGGGGEDGVYRVVSAAHDFGEVLAWPEEGTEGTEIELDIIPGSHGRYIPGALYYRILPDGDPVPVDEESKTFTLPAADVEVGADFLSLEELSRRMVTVPGARVAKNTGLPGAPFSQAGTSPVDVGGFKMAAVEVPYQLWYTVLVWGEAQNPAYRFTSNCGFEGSGARPNERKAPSELHRYDPVVNVDWIEAAVWCNVYSDWAREVKGEDTRPVYKKDGQVLLNSTSRATIPDTPDYGIRGYRLPTDAEWEFAARGGDPGSAAWKYLYPGSNRRDDVAWYSGNSGGITQAVGLKAPKTLGLYDMGGNASEWCWDVYSISGSYTNYVVRRLSLDDRGGSPGGLTIGFRVVLQEQ